METINMEKSASGLDKIQKVIAKVLSILIHPLMAPTYGLLMLFETIPYLSLIPSDAQRILLLLVFASTCVLPLALVPFFVYKKITINIAMINRSERLLPMLLTVVFYYLSYYLMSRLPVPKILITFLLASTVAVIATFIITFFWKISAHLIGMGGLVGCLLGVSLRFSVEIQPVLILLIAVTGLLAYARLRLNAHTPAQVYAGFGVGFTIMLLFTWLV